MRIKPLFRKICLVSYYKSNLKKSQHRNTEGKGSWVQGHPRSKTKNNRNGRGKTVGRAMAPPVKPLLRTWVRSPEPGRESKAKWCTQLSCGLRRQDFWGSLTSQSKWTGGLSPFSERHPEWEMPQWLRILFAQLWKPMFQFQELCRQLNTLQNIYNSISERFDALFWLSDHTWYAHTELELLTVVSSHAAAGNQNWVLCKSNKCS